MTLLKPQNNFLCDRKFKLQDIYIDNFRYIKRNSTYQVGKNLVIKTV